jgi:mannose-6-phosphate isomerase-like protein (cupin superfamily)
VNVHQLACQFEGHHIDYLEILRESSMSVGIYRLPAGAEDPQQPHQEDEAYFVLSGRGVLHLSGQDIQAEPGDLLYVPAGADHRFSPVDDLTLLVFFAPAESKGVNP